MFPVIQLPRRMQLGLAAAGALVQPRDGPRIDFGAPLGEAALAAPELLLVLGASSRTPWPCWWAALPP